MLNAANREPKEIVEPTHPFRVAAREIVVDRDQMHAAPGEGIEIKRQRRHERFAFTGCHLGDPAAMQNNAAQQLHVEVHHVPRHRLIADRETISSIFQPARRILHHRKRFRQDFIKPLPLVFELRNLGEFLLPDCGFGPQCLI